MPEDQDEDEDELLAQLEQTNSEVRAALVPVDGEEYQAFNVTDRRQLSLYTCPVAEPYQWLSYRYLLHLVAEPAGSRLDLVFSFMVVTIAGRNLLEIGGAVSKERCAFLQQFDASKWQKPRDSSAPFIESIKYLRPGPSDLTEEPKGSASS